MFKTLVKIIFLFHFKLIIKIIWNYYYKYNYIGITQKVKKKYDLS